VKTQIIHLEPHDDTISVKDKMGWSQTGRVVLVWPARGTLLDRHLDLVLLLRHSHSLGVQISLVTRDPEVRFQAKSLGIPVFKTVTKAQKSHWRRSRRYRLGASQEDYSDPERLTRIQNILSNPMHRSRETPQLSPTYRIALFSLGVLAVLSIAAVLLPSAEIALIPETRQQAITLKVQASEEAGEVKLTGTLPVRTIKTIVEGRASIQTTGTVSVPTGFASGDVQFLNLIDKTVNIPVGTVVSSSDGSQKYSTQRAARLPAGPGEAVIVPVQAQYSGGASNLPAGQINIVEGELGVNVTVENLEQFEGGGYSSSPAPAATDRSLLREQLISTLRSNALQEIDSSLAEGYVLLDDTPSLVKVITEEYSPPDLQPASELGLTLRLEFTTPYISIEDQEMLAKSILDANLPDGFIPIPGTLTIEHLSSPIYTEKEKSSWQVQFGRSIQSEPAINQAVSLSLGRSPKNASQQLMKNLPLSAPPIIVTKPSWWPVLPLLPMRIDITAGEVDHGSTDLQLLSNQ
jgi:hypothetical protein